MNKVHKIGTTDKAIMTKHNERPLKIQSKWFHVSVKIVRMPQVPKWLLFSTPLQNQGAHIISVEDLQLDVNVIL
jgi:hypothetical protein